MKKRILSMLLVIVLLLSMVPLSALAASKPKITSDGTLPYTVKLGETINLTLSGVELSEGQAVTWDGSDVASAVADVADSTKCKVTGLTEGKTKIVAKVDGAEVASYALGVYKDAEGVPSIDESNFTLSVGEKKTLNYMKPEGAFEVELTRWQSSEKSVATIGLTSGEVTAKKAGTTDITVFFNGRWSEPITLTVKDSSSEPENPSEGSNNEPVVPDPEPTVKEITVEGSSDVLVEQTLTLTTKIDGTAAAVNYEITAGAEYVQVTDNQNGTYTVTGKNPGTAKITFTYEVESQKYEGACTVKVKSNVLSIRNENGKAFENDCATMFTGGTVKLTAYDGDGNPVDDVTWASAGVADVNDGQVTANSVGSAKITASKDKYVNGELSLTVQPAAKIVLDDTFPTEILAGDSLKLNAYVVDNATGKKTPASWKLVNESDEDFCTIQDGKLGTKSWLTGRYTIGLVAYASDTKLDIVSDPYSITIIPRAKGITLTVDGKKVNDKITTLNLSDEAAVETGVTIAASINPIEAGQEVLWQIIDDNGIYTKDYESGESLTIRPNGTKRSGLITIKAVAADGTKVYATTQVKFARLGQEIMVDAPDRLRGGATINLGALVKFDEINLDDKTIIWTLENAVRDGKTVATITKAGRLSTKPVTEEHTIGVTATLKATGEPFQKYITLYPAAKSITIRRETDTGDAAVPKVLAYEKEADNEIQLKAIVKPDSVYPEDLGLKWISSDEKIAEVDQAGTLVLKGAGKVRITCQTTDGSNVRGYVYLEVTKNAKKVTVSAPSRSLTVGSSMDMKAVVYTDAKNNIKAADQRVSWSVTDELGDKTSAASISGNRLMAKNVDLPTTVVVTATTVTEPKVSGTYKVTIKPSVQKTLHIYRDDQVMSGTYTMDLKDSCVLDGKWVISGNGNVKDADECTFFSSNERVATVDRELGVLTAVGYGTSTITMKCFDPQTENLFTTTFTVRVANTVKSVTIGVPNNVKNLRSGNSIGLSATAWTDVANGVKAENQGFTWEIREIDGDNVISEDIDFASISPSGVLSVGTVTYKRMVEVLAISKENGVLAAVEFNLYPKEECKLTFVLDGTEYSDILPVDLDEGLDGLAVNVYTAFNKNGYIEDASEEDVSVTWASDNKKVIDVSADGKTLTVKAVGKARLTAYYYNSGNRATYQASITAVVNQTMGAVVIQQSTILVSGKYTYMRAVPANENATNKNVLWSVDEDDKDFVTINTYTGKLSAKPRLTEQVTVTVYADPVDGSIGDECEVIVYPLTTKVEIYGEDTECINNKTVNAVLSDGTMSFTASVKPGDAYSDTFKWTSSNKSVAEVDAEGYVTLKKTGAATIKATALDGSGKYAQFKLRITNK